MLFRSVGFSPHNKSLQLSRPYSLHIYVICWILNDAITILTIHRRILGWFIKDKLENVLKRSWPIWGTICTFAWKDDHARCRPVFPPKFGPSVSRRAFRSITAKWTRLGLQYWVGYCRRNIPREVNLRAKLSVYLIRHLAMKIHGEWRYSSTFSISVLDEGTWWDTGSDRFLPEE
jgi:hypothetical protein